MRRSVGKEPGAALAGAEVTSAGSTAAGVPVVGGTVAPAWVDATTLQPAGDLHAPGAAHDRRRTARSARQPAAVRKPASRTSAWLGAPVVGREPVAAPEGADVTSAGVPAAGVPVAGGTVAPPGVDATTSSAADRTCGAPLVAIPESRTTWGPSAVPTGTVIDTDTLPAASATVVTNAAPSGCSITATSVPGAHPLDVTTTWPPPATESLSRVTDGSE